MTRSGFAGVRRSWDRFWFAEGPTTAFGLFRILFAICLALEVENTFHRSAFAVEGGFHLPYSSFLGPMTPATHRLLHTLQYPLIALLGLGLAARIAAAGLVVLQGLVFFSDQMNFRNHPYFFLLILFLLAFTPCDDALSVSSARARQWLGGRRSLAGQRLVQFQVCLVYLFAALHKVHAGFLRGDVLSYYVSEHLEKTPLWAVLGWIGNTETQEAARAFLLVPSNIAVPAVVSLVLELGLPAGLLFRKTRTLAIAMGIAFHASIAITMNIREFSLAMISSYVLFLDPESVRRGFERAAARLQPARARR